MSSSYEVTTTTEELPVESRQNFGLNPYSYYYNTPYAGQLGNRLSARRNYLKRFGAAGSQALGTVASNSVAEQSDATNNQGLGYLDYFDDNNNVGATGSQLSNLGASGVGATGLGSTGLGTTGLGVDAQSTQASLSAGLGNQRGTAALIAARRRNGGYGGMVGADQLNLRSSGYGYGGSGGSGYGGYGQSGGYNNLGYNQSPCTTGLNPILLLLTLGGIAAGAFLVVTKLNQGRKKRSFQLSFLEEIFDNAWFGLEEFENKIDKIASGHDDDSWIGQLYNQFSTSLLDQPADDGLSNTDADGLEPPVFDETWDSNLGDNNSTVVKREISNQIPEGPMKVVLDDVIPELIYGESDCEKDFFKCVSGILVNGGMHYMNEPEGVSGSLKSMLFKVAFHGGFGNVWNALMTIPEARGIKRCFNTKNECISKQLLVEELEKSGVDAKEANRLLINPDFAQATDLSDGSEMFSPEDQKLEDELTQN